jgi:tRNA pseudouridine55 synthase
VNPANGVLVVDKPKGVTSHDVVNATRRLTGTRRVGHAGTLDPMATGVLVLLVGITTRLSRFVMQGEKQYRGIIHLGATTTTYDAEGDVIERAPVTVDRAAIEAVLPRFRGDIQQIPPMYAAIKVRGRKLYELAREGKEIERRPRTITIQRIEILDWSSPDLTVDVTCSSGTYIRSLAHDIGAALACGGHLRALQRLRSGGFTLEQAHSLEALQALHAAGNLRSAMLPPKAALGSMPSVELTPDQVRAIRYGQTIALELAGQPDPIQAHDTAGHLVAVLIGAGDQAYRPTVVLPDPLT